jgi:hypothetical protein
MYFRYELLPVLQSTLFNMFRSDDGFSTITMQILELLEITWLRSMVIGGGMM